MAGLPSFRTYDGAKSGRAGGGYVLLVSALAIASCLFLYEHSRISGLSLRLNHHLAELGALHQGAAGARRPRLSPAPCQQPAGLLPALCLPKWHSAPPPPPEALPPPDDVDAARFQCRPLPADTHARRWEGGFNHTLSGVTAQLHTLATRVDKMDQLLTQADQATKTLAQQAASKAADQAKASVKELRGEVDKSIDSVLAAVAKLEADLASHQSETRKALLINTKALSGVLGGSSRTGGAAAQAEGTATVVEGATKAAEGGAQATQAAAAGQQGGAGKEASGHDSAATSGHDSATKEHMAAMLHQLADHPHDTTEVSKATPADGSSPAAQGRQAQQSDGRNRKDTAAGANAASGKGEADAGNDGDTKGDDDADSGDMIDPADDPTIA